MGESVVSQTIGGIRWMVRREFADRLRPLLERINRVIADSRPVKHVRIKSLHEIAPGVASIPAALLIKVYHGARGIGRVRELFRRNRAIREMALAVEAAGRGVGAVVPLAAGCGGGRGIVVVEKMTGWEGLDRRLGDGTLSAAERRRVIESYGRFAREVHEAGIWQDDFNPGNVLIRRRSSDVDLLLVDFERVTLHRGISWRRRIWSLAKMNRIAGVSRCDRVRFLEAYLQPDHIDERKAVAGRILRVGRDVLRRDLRRLEANCVRENRNFGKFALEGCRGYYRKRRADDDALGLTRDEIAAVVRGEMPCNSSRKVCGDVTGRWREMNVEERLGRVEGRPADVPILAVMKRGGDGYILVKSRPGNIS